MTHRLPFSCVRPLSALETRSNGSRDGPRVSPVAVLGTELHRVRPAHHRLMLGGHSTSSATPISSRPRPSSRCHGSHALDATASDGLPEEGAAGPLLQAAVSSTPWLSLRATRARACGSGLPVDACRQIGWGCIQGWRVAVVVGCGKWCGNRV